MRLSSFIVAIFFLFSCLSSVYAQRIIRTGTPYVKQYSKLHYKAGNQNWGLAIGKEGILYAANTEGLLSFDGQFWNLHPLNNKSIVRSVAIAEDGKIYTGGMGEFGYWIRKKYGRMQYIALSGLVPNQDLLLNDEIWKILIVDDKIYFHSFSKCYLYENKKIKIITGQGEAFLFPHVVQKQIFFEQIPSGLYRLEETTLSPIADHAILANKSILCMLPYDNKHVLIGTANSGLYKMDKSGKITPWITQADHLLKNAQLNNGIDVYAGHFAFGTIQNGVIIINKNGEIVQHINKHNGLQNNTVLSITKDHQNNLWVGLDNGIDRIEINSSLYYYSDFSGKIGTVYTSAIHGSNIYLGTNQGLYVSTWKGLNTYNTFDFELIPHSNGQVWSLKKIGNKLICGHNNGTFAVEDRRLEPISNITGGWEFTNVFGTNLVLQGNYTGLSLFQGDTHFSWIKQFPKINEPVRYVKQKTENEFWIGNTNALKLIRFQPSMIAQKEIQYLAQSTLKNYGIYSLENTTVFTTDSGLYVYDEIVKKFKPHQEVNEKLGSYKFANKIIPINLNSYWFIKKSQIAKVEIKGNGALSIDSMSLSPLNGKMMHFYENILPIEMQMYLIGLDNGFAIYDDHSKRDHKIGKPLISHVWNTTNELQPIDTDPIVLRHSQNNIRIAYSSPWYTSTAIQYQYFLEGYSKQWSDWDETPYRDFTNLNFGTYNFKVQAKAKDGEISAIAELYVKVEAPWYLHWLAILAYLALTGIALFYFDRWNKKRILARQEMINRALLEQQKLDMAREVELNEQKLIKLSNQQLQKELEIKNRELANSAMNIVYKNEMLNNLHAELKNVKDSDGTKLNSDHLRRVNKLIEDAHNDDRDWDIFERSFNEAHENFFKKLKVDYPELVPNDLKLCAYLRLNMSSKEIASLLNITTRGVEIRRYRLRKKLNLPTEKNLSEFLLER